MVVVVVVVVVPGVEGGTEELRAADVLDTVDDLTRCFECCLFICVDIEDVLCV